MSGVDTLPARRLAAILVADIVGYSRLVGLDERSTLASLRDIQASVLQPTIGEHRGRIVKTTGDGFIAEFASVVDAVQFAITFQARASQRQVAAKIARPLVFRIGINLGDVVVDDDDILGDGVNVAARIEPLCPPGGVMITGTVYDQLQGKTEFPIEPSGEQLLKNIKRPVRTYILRPDGITAGWRYRAVKRLLRKRMTIVGVGVLIVSLVGVWLYQTDWTAPNLPMAQSAPAAPPTGGLRGETHSQLPTLAVMPLDNLSNDPGLDYFSQGTTENLAMTIGRSPYVRVVQVPASAIDAGDRLQAARDMGAQYVLSGSVQRGSNQFRIIAEMLDANDGSHLWSTRFDRSSADPFAVQDEIADAVNNAISGERGVLMQEMHDIALNTEGVLFGVYDYYLKGHAEYIKETKADTEKAMSIWKEGLSRFPDSALLKVKVAWGYNQLYYLGVSDDGPADLKAALDLANEALAGAKVPKLAKALGHWVLCNVHGDSGDWEKASPECRRTIELMPNDPYVRHGLAWFPIAEGKLDEASAMLSQLTPHSANARWGYGAYTWLLFAREDYSRCVEAADEAPQPTVFFTVPFKAACLAALGRIEEAREVAEQLMEDSKGASIDFFRTYHGSALTDAVERETEMLRRAGLRENAA